MLWEDDERAFRVFLAMYNVRKRIEGIRFMKEATEKPRFVTQGLDVRLVDDDKIWQLESPLIYHSAIVGAVHVPAGFQTDFASVPRVPIAYTLYGNRAHREGVIHDYLFRKNSYPRVTFDEANKVFLEAMKCRGKSRLVRLPMYWAVCAFSRKYFHRLKVLDRLV